MRDYMPGEHTVMYGETRSEPKRPAMSEPDPATTAYFAATADGAFDHQRDAYEQGYEDGAAHRPCMLCDDIRTARTEARAAERQRLAAVITPDYFRRMADWFDEDDRVKMLLFDQDGTLPSIWAKRGQGLQDDLRRFADLLDGDRDA